MAGLKTATSRRGLAAMALSLGLLLAASLCFAQEQVSSPPGRGQGVVEIEGQAIESLTLTGAKAEITLDKPRNRAVVPVGRYRVTDVQLAEGYHLKSVISRTQPDWFTVAADSPTKLVIGGPLISTVTASRTGSVLKLDYTLVDAAGRVYSPGTTTDPPTFKVFKGDRQIGSGTFAYG